MPPLTLTMGKLPRARPRRRASGPKSLLLPAALLLACAGEAARPPRTSEPPVAREQLAPSEAFDRDWAERDLRRVPAVVTLPNARAWHASASGTFTVLEQRATHSTLALRVTLAPRLVKPEQCEAEARLARPALPAVDPSSVVERRSLAAPAGFDVRLVVGVTPVPNGVHGYALAIGAGTSRCYVAVFETESEGAGAADRVAERLAVLVSGTLETLRVPSAERYVPPPVGVE
jgi:hypothetical protein